MFSMVRVERGVSVDHEDAWVLPFSGRRVDEYPRALPYPLGESYSRRIAAIRLSSAPTTCAAAKSGLS